MSIGGSALYAVIASIFKSTDYGFGLKGFLFDIPVLFNAAILAIPAYLGASRWLKTRHLQDGFLPAPFRSAKRLGYISGLAWIYLGHITLLITAGLIAYYFLKARGERAPLGFGIGWGLWMYAFGILCVEVSIRRWERAKRR